MSSGPPGYEADRAAALMRQRMAQTNGNMPAGASPRRAPPFNPPPPPSMPMPRPSPPPPGAPVSVKRMTGSGRKIPHDMDPLTRSSRKPEKATAEAPGGHKAVYGLIFGVLVVMAFAAIFVLPRQLKVFWVVTVGLTAFLLMGMAIYKEMIESNYGDDSSVPEYAHALLFGIMALYSGVMVGMLVFMLWSLYSIANTRTNVMNNNTPPFAPIGMESQIPPPPRLVRRSRRG